MMKSKEISTPTTAVENNLNFKTIPRRHAERREQSNPSFIKPETLVSQQPRQKNSLSSIKGIIDRRIEERRKSRPAFLTFEELIRLRKNN